MTLWTYNSEPIDENALDNYVGYVYCITNIVDDRRYIGKKLFKFKKSKTIKGKKKKFLIESDWKEYWGSNKNLQEDVKELGEGSFKREILRLCKTRGEMSYFESKFQFELGVLETNSFYNEWIMCKVHRSHLKKLDFSEKVSIMKLYN
jgi:hypothetical protein